MKTYQDFMEAGALKADFCLSLIPRHENEYQQAVIATEYYERKNPTIRKYRKMLYNTMGQAVPDLFSPNYKLTHGFFRRFVIQQTQYVLSNGVTFGKSTTKKKLGKNFDNQVQKLAKLAMVQGVSFGFWNLDHLEVFSLVPFSGDPTGFIPFWDENTSMLRAGVRYWKDTNMALRYTIYEEDGYTEYIKRKDMEFPEALSKKRPYITVVHTVGDEIESTSYSNYPGFPIIPMYANDLKCSEIVGIRPSLDCYDFIKSGMANNVDEASAFYWVVENCGGMDDNDLMRFVDRMKTIKAANVNTADGTNVSAHTLTVPVDANEKLLDRLRSDLYEDFMLLDTEKALSGNLTATAIRMAYQPQDDKCGDFEYCIREFIGQLFEITGIDDEPSFKWNRIANQTEETNMVMVAATYLDDDTVVDKLPFLTPEEADLVKKRRAAEEMSRFDGSMDEDDDEPVEEEGAAEDDEQTTDE